MKARINLIRILLILSTVEGVLALTAFLAAPSDQDSSLLFGYSLSRLAAAAITALLILGLLYFAARSFRDTAWLNQSILSLHTRLQNNTLFAFVLIFLTIFLLLLGWLMILYSDALDTSFATLHAVLNRLIPLVVWAYLLGLKLFWLAGTLARSDTPQTAPPGPGKRTPLQAAAPTSTWPRILNLAAQFAAIFFILLFGFITISRIAYPYELEWMESGSLVQTERVLSGKPLYTEPSIQYIPFIYTSFYLYVSALVTRALGFGYLALRVVSLLSTLGSFGLIYLLVHAKTGKKFPALMALGLFAASFPLSGGWFDIARVDSLFLFLLMLAGWLLFRNKDQDLFLAGVILALAYFTKQTALAIILALGGFSFIINPKRIYLVLAPLLTLLVAGVVVENLVSGGWYKYYTIDLVATHRMETNYLSHFLAEFLYRDLFSHLPLAFIILAVGAVLSIKHTASTRRWDLTGNHLVEVLAAALVLLAWGARMNAGNYLNVLMPAFAGIAILFGLAISQISSTFPWVGKPAFASLLYLGCLLQFGLLYYQPSDHIPTSADRAAGDQLMQTLSTFEGEIYIPFHNAYPLFIGKNAYAHKVALDEIFGNFGAGVPEFARQLDAEFTQAFQQQRFEAIFLDEGALDFDPYYVCSPYPWPDEDVFYPVTGAPVRADLLCLPNRSASQ